MAIKPRSQKAGEKKTPNPADIERLAQSLADKPYGEQMPASPTQTSPTQTKIPESEKAKPITISLPPSLIANIQDQAISNKRAGLDLRTVSAIIKDALEKAGY